MPGFETEALAKTHALCIGAGGLLGAIALPLARKGIGQLTIVDGDVVELSNLSRQEFLPEDLYQPKAFALAKNAARQGGQGTLCVGHYTAFSDTTGPALLTGCSLVICGVDSNRCRIEASRLCRQRRLPVIFTAVNQTADFGWCFVQEVGGPCLACLYPHMAAAAKKPQPCTVSPAVLDILRVVGGLVLYATDSLIMPRRRDWMFRSVGLIGDVPDCMGRVERRATCPVCSDGNSEETKEGGT